MAKIIDWKDIPDRKVDIPGLKPPIKEFVTCPDLTQEETDEFNRMIRELRGHPPKPRQDQK
jgi:hypothetical protein